MFHWESFSIRSLNLLLVYSVRFLTRFVSYLVKVLYLGCAKPGDLGVLLFCWVFFKIFFLLI